ncbi:transmembrane ascorbate ferrireductase 1-like isoform X1 [Prosopis cineraria]|uniref:transmembrane ascorbate ferrireductase 1-like isoform X1 n=1 Tax=Prosopis cineraria TaxID=364024 RepID=UPI00240F4B95|nr:transmembrane ascorbate ferrireductase 1-like isoform X1 [Prosopis cineraria]
MKLNLSGHQFSVYGTVTFEFISFCQSECQSFHFLRLVKPKVIKLLVQLLIHPVLMIIGLIVIGGEAIISYKSLALKKELKKLIHLVLHAIAIALGIIGIYCAFKYHNESGIANLYSLHSWLGIVVISLYCIQWLYGFLTFFFPGGSAFLRQESLPWHVLFGLIVYVLAVGTATLGFLEKLTFLENSGLAKYGAEALLVNFTAVITVLFGAFVVLTVISQGSTSEDDYTAI